jgi:hypothetical protein
LSEFQRDNIIFSFSHSHTQYRLENHTSYQGILCAQLAETDCPFDATFERTGPPDAGVECYCVFPDGTEWGWQAKYFDGLDHSQWAQLDHSVKTALDKHPRLIRYFVCIPLDKSDARIGRQRS